MALISCPDCANRVSDLAPSCPWCGRPIRDRPPRPKRSRLHRGRALAILALVAAVWFGPRYVVEWVRARYEPAEQREWLATWATLKASWEAAASNAAARAEYEAKARGFFARQVHVGDWTATVRSVRGGLDAQWVRAEIGGAVFHVRARDEPYPEAFKSFRDGDRIVFSGDMVAESSWTLSGAIDTPEMTVIATRVQKARLTSFGWWDPR